MKPISDDDLRAVEDSSVEASHRLLDTRFTVADLTVSERAVEEVAAPLAAAVEEAKARAFGLIADEFRREGRRDRPTRRERHLLTLGVDAGLRAALETLARLAGP